MIKLTNAVWLGLCGLALLCGSCLYAYQRPWRLFESLEAYDDIALPADGQAPAEFVFARLKTGDCQRENDRDDRIARVEETPDGFHSRIACLFSGGAIENTDS